MEADEKVAVRTTFDAAAKRWILQMEVVSEAETGGVKFRPTGGVWDLSRYDSVYFDLRNPSNQPLVVYAKVANGDTPNLLDNCRMATILMPNESACAFGWFVAPKIPPLNLSRGSSCITTTSMSATTP